MVQTAEGNLDEVHSMLQRIRELAVQYKNGSLDDDGPHVDPERGRPAGVRDQPHRHARRSSTASTCWTAPRTVSFQVGANDGEQIGIALVDLATAVGTSYVVAVADAAPRASRTIDAAINAVSTARAAFGAVQNRLDHSLSVPPPTRRT